jgi:hypothetical protein
MPSAKKKPSWDEVKDKVLGAKKKAGKNTPGREEVTDGMKHEIVGKTVGGVKARPVGKRPEEDSVFYKEGTRSGNRSKPFDTGR